MASSWAMISDQLKNRTIFYWITLFTIFYFMMLIGMLCNSDNWLQYLHIFHILDAISAIETGESLPLMLPHCSLLSDATQLSLVCCEVVVRSNKCSVLLSLIRSCTRSDDHQELLRYVRTYVRTYAWCMVSINLQIKMLQKRLDLLVFYFRKCLNTLLNICRHKNLSGPVAGKSILLM